MGTVAVDSSVVIALFDSEDAHHAAAEQAVRAARDGGGVLCMSAIVLAESLAGAERLGSAEASERLTKLVRLFGAARPVDQQVAAVAAGLRVHHAWLRLPDALVLATAAVDGADVVLTCDRRWSRVSAAVTVVGTRRRRPGSLRA